MGSVDCWPLAITFSRHLGVSPDQYPAIFLAVTGGRYPPLEWHMSQVHEELLSSQRIAVADCHLGNSVGAIGWHPGIRCSNRSACPGSRGFGLQGPASFRLTTLATHREGSSRDPTLPGWDLRFKIVTWLILPVVICLSQRLSHACLSISNLYGETANGSLNQLSFI